ncbi:MAG: hypothetical protein SGARI_002097, partial [Bacillariaceae sp.]
MSLPYTLLTYYALLFLTAVSAEAEAKKRRPNILLLITDDQDVLLGTFDHMPKVKEHLQHQGLTFENAFVHTP